MALYQTLVLAIPASDSAGDALSIDGRDGKYVELFGTFSAVIGIEISFDGGVTWREVQSLAEPGGFFLDEPATHIRAVTSGFVSGVPEALIRASQ
jgi:hypothetical protein